MMYDAAAATTVAAANHHHHQHDWAGSGPNQGADKHLPVTTNTGGDSSSTAPQAKTLEQAPNVQTPPSSGTGSGHSQEHDKHSHNDTVSEPMPHVVTWAKDPTEIVFIDAQVPDAQILAKGAKAGVEVVMLDANSDGVQQIANFLSRHPDPNLTTIDIVAHGADGVVQLGTTLLSSSTIAYYQSQLAAIGHAMQPGGTIQIFGCDVAQDMTGDLFLAQLSQATGGKNIDASSHLVGAAALGGSWALNVQLNGGNGGSPAAANPFTDATLAAYSDVLPDEIFVTSINPSGVTADSTGAANNTATLTTTGTLIQPTYIAVDPAHGVFYVVDNENGLSSAHEQAIYVGAITGTLADGHKVDKIFSVPAADFDLFGGIALDPGTNTLYFAQSASFEYNAGSPNAHPLDQINGIFSLNLNNLNLSSPTGPGTLSETLVAYGPTLGVFQGDIALDAINHKIYFIDDSTGGDSGNTSGLDPNTSATNDIYVATIGSSPSLATSILHLAASDTFNGQMVPTGYTQGFLSGLALDPTNQTLYFSTWDLNDSATLGTGIDNVYKVAVPAPGNQIILPSPLFTAAAVGDPFAVKVDVSTGQLYVLNRNANGNENGSIVQGAVTGGATTKIFAPATGTPAPVLESFALDAAAVLTASGNTTTYSEGSSATTIDAGSLTVTTLSNPGENLAGATVSISGGFDSGHDTLQFTAQNGISAVSFAGGVLTLSGVASAADYAAALKSVTFFSTGSSSTAQRTIDFAVTDGVVSSNTGTDHVNVTLPAIAVNDVSHSEGNAGTTAYTFTVSLNAASAQTVSVHYATADGTATTADGDYTATSGVLTFNPGVTSQTVTVNVNGDTKFELDEAFTLVLSAATNASIADNSGTGTIVNDDAQPTISINDVSQNEGNSGTTPFAFTVSLSNASYQSVTVNYATADGTATVAGNDYLATSGTLTFLPGQTTKTVTVLVNGDTTPEGNETFTVGLTTPGNATIARSSGTGTIVDDDDIPPAVSFDTVNFTDTGTLGDFVTNNGAVTFSGTTSDADGTVASVAIYNGASFIGTAAINGGTWSLATTLAEGSYTQLKAIATDNQGVSTTANSATSLTVDTTADAAPFATLTEVDPLINNTEKTAVAYTVAGLDPDAATVVTVTDGTHTLTHSYAADGSFAFDLSAFNDGTVTSSMLITDAAGNTKSVTGSTITLDTTADVAPLATLTESDPLINNAEKTAVAYAVAGLDADASAAVTVTDGTHTLTHSYAADGSFAFDLSAFNDGTVTSSMLITDAAGNTKSVTGSTITLDTTADVAPLATLTESNPLINNAEKTAAAYTVAGLDADASALVTVTDGTHTLTHSYAADGSFAFDLSAFNDGTVTSSMLITDAAGNTKSVTGSTITLDTTADVAPLATLTESNPLINNAEKTAVAYTVAGLDADAGALVTVTDGTHTLTHSYAADGSFAFDLSAFTDGTVTSSMLIADAAGNAKSVTGSTITLDTTADVAPLATLTESNPLINNAEKTAAAYTVAGLDADASALVTVTDGTHTLTHSYAADGSFAFDLSAFTDGTVTSSMLITDAAGNTKSVTGSTITLDTTADVAPLATLTESNPLINNAEKTAVAYTVAGLDADASALVTVTDGTHTLTHSYAADGSFAFNLSAFNDGPVTSSMLITDLAGNTRTASGNSTTLDTTAPTATVAIAAIETDTGASASDFLTNDTSLTVTGTNTPLGAGETVQVSGDGGANWGNATQTDGTHWSFADPTNHSATFTYQVRVTDAAGNIDVNTASQLVTIDTTPPSIPTDTNGVANSVAEGAAVGTTVGLTASSSDVNAFTYSLIADTSGGGFTIDPSRGIVTVADPTKIDFESSGAGHSYDVTVQALDIAGNASTKTFTIAVVDVAPVAVAETFTTNEDTPLVVAAAQGLLANDHDVNGGALTAVLDSGPAHGTLTLNADGSFRYLSAQDYNGPDSFTYHASDGTLPSNTVTVSLNILPVNDAPVVVAGNTLSFDANNRHPVVVDPAISVHDVDNTTLASAKVAITGGFEAANDKLGFVNQNGITGSFNSATGVLTLTGVASVADYQAALASVTFASTTQRDGARTIQWTADDGSAQFHQSLPATTTLHVKGFIAPPPVFSDHDHDHDDRPPSRNPEGPPRFFDDGPHGPLVLTIDGFGDRSGSGSGFYRVHTDAVLTTTADATARINLALAALEAPLGGDVVLVTARLANGDPLPDWLTFDPATGTFAGLPPDGAMVSIQPHQSADNNVVTGSISQNADLGIAGLNAPARLSTITIKVTARDSRGNIAVSVFTIDLRAHVAGKQGWNIDRTGRPFGYEHNASAAMLSPELAAIEAAVRDVTRPVEPFALRGVPIGYGERISADAAEVAPAGRAGLTEQLASIGWRSMAAQRNALLASLQQGR